MDQKISIDVSQKSGNEVGVKENLYLVESPFQALAALEASLMNRGERNYIVLLLSGSSKRARNNQQIKNVISLGDWSGVYQFTSDSTCGAITRVYSLRKLLRYISREYRNRIDKLYLGEFRSMWMHQCRLLLSPSQVWLLDDGTASIEAVENYIGKGIFCPDFLSSRAFLKNLVKRIFYGLNRKKVARLASSPINIYSAFFDEEAKSGFPCSIEIQRNRFTRVRKIYDKTSPSRLEHGNGYVYYYGSKYSEAGVIDYQYEIDFLGQVVGYYKGKGLQFKYFAHRDDSSRKLEQIVLRYGIQVVVDEDIAELSLLRSSEIPSEIATAYSSIISSLGIFFPNVKKTCFKLDPGQIHTNFRNEVDLTYEFFSSSGIEVVSFEHAGILGSQRQV